MIEELTKLDKYLIEKNTHPKYPDYNKFNIKDDCISYWYEDIDGKFYTNKKEYIRKNKIKIQVNKYIDLLTSLWKYKFPKFSKGQLVKTNSGSYEEDILITKYSFLRLNRYKDSIRLYRIYKVYRISNRSCRGIVEVITCEVYTFDEDGLQKVIS